MYEFLNGETGFSRSSDCRVVASDLLFPMLVLEYRSLVVYVSRRSTKASGPVVKQMLVACVLPSKDRSPSLVALRMRLSNDKILDDGDPDRAGGVTKLLPIPADVYS